MTSFSKNVMLNGGDSFVNKFQMWYQHSALAADCHVSNTEVHVRLVIVNCQQRS